jgi:hypothetical protein
MKMKNKEELGGSQWKTSKAVMHTVQRVLANIRHFPVQFQFSFVLFILVKNHRRDG